MDIVRTVIARPVSVTVGVILLVMFGLIGLGAIPVQLVPDIDRPIVTVTTAWVGRSPQEVVEEIAKEQEAVLKSLANLKNMTSVSSEGSCEIVLEFYLGSSVERALQEVSDALRRVPAYPEDVDEPVIKAAEGAAENGIAWIILDVSPEARPRHPGFDISTLFDAMDQEVKPYLERVDGVAEVNIYGGREEELQVLLDPAAMAQRGLGHGDVVRALRAQNRNTSAGTLAEGKRDWRVRVVGQYEAADEILETVVAWRDGVPVRVRDIGRVERGHAKPRGFVRSFGTPVLAMNIIRQSGANVLDLMTEVRARLDEIRVDLLPALDPEVGPDLRLTQVYDETVYLSSAIALVTQNLWVGGLIAAVVLLVFLRSFVTTGVIGLAIPLSIIGTFLVMLATGRTLNVISLAGLAFAVGMVVDNAIVVLENIHRRLQEGDGAVTAAYRGAREVWGAILASTLTTVAVFVPVLTLREEAGQLFRDIALAIVAAVSLSLVVSIAVIPAACSRWLRRRPTARRRTGVGPADRLARAVEWLITGWRAHVLRPGLIAVMTGASLIGSFLLAPPIDYLPAGNRNLVFGGLLIPPGYSVQQQESIAERIEERILPYALADIEDPEQVAALPPIPRRGGDPFAPVPIEQFFIGGFGTLFFTGATSQDPRVVIPVGALLTGAMSSIPDAFGGARQASIFGRADSGNSIDVQISGPHLDRVRAAAGMIMGLAGSRFGFASVRPEPANFNLDQPEWQVSLNDVGRELGLTTEELGLTVRSLVDGTLAGDVPRGLQNVDLVVLPARDRVATREALARVPVATPAGRVVPLESVAHLTAAQAPQAIQRIEELPAVTIQISPPHDRPLADVMREIEGEIVGAARGAGLIDASMRVRLEGTAAKLDEVEAALFGTRGTGRLATWWQRGLAGVGALAGALGLLLAGLAVARSRGPGRAGAVYGALGTLVVGTILAALLVGIAVGPHVVMARFVWALAVTYLLMCALFESFTHPFVIMFSVPVAIIGGFAGLRIVHAVTLADPTQAPQQLDVLTMLGFVILIGVVVNNAILLVHQALRFMRGSALEGADAEPLPPAAAIARSVRTRVRPIFMSTLTSVGGMLPLVLFPGAGSEMYRGLGSVVVGGLLVATLFTLVLVPLVLSLALDVAEGLSGLRGLPSGPAGGAGPGRDPVAAELARASAADGA